MPGREYRISAEEARRIIDSIGEPFRPNDRLSKAINRKFSAWARSADWLEAMASHRARAIEQRRAGYDLSWTEYGFARMCAMRPVSGLAKADMLANAQRCVNRIDELRGL